MSRRCESPIGWPELVAYATNDGADADLERTEQHLMACSDCTAAAERVLALTSALADLPPPILRRDEVEPLRARGLRIVENPISEGERRPVTFGTGVDIVLHRLGGLDLTATERVHVTVRTEAGDVLFEEPDAPFDRDAGELLIACQRHFRIFPPVVCFEVQLCDASGGERRALYVIPHVFEQ